MSQFARRLAVVVFPLTALFGAGCGSGSAGRSSEAATQRTTVSILPAASRAALASSPLRMLLLPAAYAPHTIVTTGPAWTALSYRDDVLTISLHATNVTHAVIDPAELARLPPPQATVRGSPARVTLNEQIRSVAWSEHGVEYALEVECSHAFDDSRCTAETFVLDLANRLEATP